MGFIVFIVAIGLLLTVGPIIIFFLVMYGMPLIAILFSRMLLRVKIYSVPFVIMIVSLVSFFLPHYDNPLGWNSCAGLCIIYSTYMELGLYIAIIILLMMIYYMRKDTEQNKTETIENKKTITNNESKKINKRKMKKEIKNMKPIVLESNDKGE